MLEFPIITEADVEAARLRAVGDICEVTVCECGSVQFMHRLGCGCGRWVGEGASHEFMHKGEIITSEFSFYNPLSLN